MVPCMSSGEMNFKLGAEIVLITWTRGEGTCEGKVGFSQEPIEDWT